MAKTRASAKKPAAKKPAAKKPAAKKKPVAAKQPAPAKKPAPTPAPRAKKSVGKRKGPPPIDELDASDVLARITVFSRAEADADDDLEPLLVRLEQIADPSLVPALFGALDDDDPLGVLWRVFYVLESFDDPYLDGLLDVLPDLYARAPGWAETAILRIANTRGEPEDCTASLVALARKRKAPAKKKLVALIRKIAKETDGVNAPQRRSVEQLATAIEA